MSDNNSLESDHATFNRLHAELERRMEELEWDFGSIGNDQKCVTILNEEARLAKRQNDQELFWKCYEDAGYFGDPFLRFEWEMLENSAAAGNMDASAKVADGYFEGFAPGGVDLDKALRYAMEHLDRGGEVDDFEFLYLDPPHDCPIDDMSLPWLKKVVTVRPTDQCRYVLARCYWDIEDAMRLKVVFLEKITSSDSDQERDMALPLYEKAADDGYFWAQYFYGLYLLLVGGEGMKKGGGYLEQALMNIPEEPEPDQNDIENDETRRWLQENIEKALFKYTERVSTRVMELEKNAQHGELMACIELAIAYLKGEECPRNCDKALDYASRLLFEGHEFDVLLNRMDDLPKAERDWLEKNLHKEAIRIEEWNKG